jgi:cytochrome c-type biogenesis protein CcmH
MRRACLFIFLCSVVLTAQCWSEAEQAKFDRLVKEIRCVTCPNQTIADSQAPVATAMKEDIRRRLERGESEQAIRDYLISHYGDYVSYWPPVQKNTLLLWWGPFIMLVVGVAIWGTFFFRKRDLI